MNRLTFLLGLGFILLMLTVPYVSASWVLVPNGSFESGSVGSIPNQWSMVTRNWDEHGGTTFTNDMQQIDTKYFEGARSLWLHSRVVDTDGTRQMRDAWTEAVTEDWINAPSATHVRVFMRDIKSTHSPSWWGWCNHIFLLINNVSVAKTYSGGVWYDMLFTHGEFLSWNHYNYTATGTDGQSWYVYEYSIPESVDKTHMKIQIACNAHDWTFYSTSYFSDLEFVVDKVELFELIPNGSFEEGTLCTVPDSWVMKTWDRDGEEPVSGATYLHDVCENDTHYFSGNRSCWLYSKVIDTDGTKASRASWTWIESENWIDAPGAAYVRFHIRDIQPKHTSGLWWGWNDGIYIGFNDSDTDRIYDYFIYNDGETLNFNHYNSTKIGADGATWYEYIYRIPADINTSQMRFRIICIAGDWTFYDPSYFAEMSFYVDDVDLLYQSTPLVSISPSAASIYVGESVTFTSTVSGGTLPYSYQWCLNGNPVSGATSSTWTFTPVTTGTCTVYLNVTENLGGTAKSNAASVTVAPQLTASISPTSASVLVGQSVAFTSTVSGGYVPYSYQWYLNGNPVSGANATSWTFTPTTSGIYYIHLKVTDAKANTAQSETARIVVAAVSVGGYSVSFDKHPLARPLTLNLTLAIGLALFFVAFKRKTTRRD